MQYSSAIQPLPSHISSRHGSTHLMYRTLLRTEMQLSLIGGVFRILRDRYISFLSKTQDCDFLPLQLRDTNPDDCTDTNACIVPFKNNMSARIRAVIVVTAMVM